ncbi:MAG: flagellar assembly protein FliH [Desulforhopalus sp.]|jgi:flagellar assembly protein FliH
MSLSKYYKDSSSFKREEIVKPSSSDLKGWTSNETTPTAPFEPGNINAPQIGNKPTNPPPKTTLPAEQSLAGVNQAESETITTTQQAPSPVDLSKYISLEDAEAKANAMYEQGINEGFKKAADDYGSASKALTIVCEQLDTVRETIITNSSNEFKEFALLIAEKIIRISLKEQDQTIIATIEEALQKAVKSDEFTVFIHPDDYQVVSDKSADLISGISGLNNIVIKTDPTLERGGAKIESENCIIDATVSSQFEAIRDELKSKRE